ncbi:MAG TPA: hypothetical protein DIC36_07395, partial [Gammaproteobacteria bacterium]|nr:hypothetical protein [Gammaproteobacteria bacterium]
MDTAWLNPSDLQSMAGIGYRNAVLALQKALQHGKPWRGAKLKVRQVERNGGKTGYQVSLDSLPEALQTQYKQLPLAGLVEMDRMDGMDGMDAAGEAEPVQSPSPPAPLPEGEGSYSPESLWALWDTVGEKKQASAETRLQTLLAVERRTAQGDSVEQAIAALDVPRRTYYNWLGLVNKKARADWLPALLPAHAGNPASAKVFDPRIMEAFKDYYL